MHAYRSMKEFFMFQFKKGRSYYQYQSHGSDVQICNIYIFTYGIISHRIQVFLPTFTIEKDHPNVGKPWQFVPWDLLWWISRTSRAQAFVQERSCESLLGSQKKWRKNSILQVLYIRGLK